MISICRKLSRGWNNFELMVSICTKLSWGRNLKKKVPTPAQLFQPLTNCKPLKRAWCRDTTAKHICANMREVGEAVQYHCFLKYDWTRRFCSICRMCVWLYSTEYEAVLWKFEASVNYSASCDLDRSEQHNSRFNTSTTGASGNIDILSRCPYCWK